MKKNHLIFKTDQIQAIEKKIFSAGIFSPQRLMELAAKSVIENLILTFGKPSALSIFCGRGNNGADGYPNHMARWLNRKLQTDFGFTWTKFQYAGANSQTHGQNGTCHSDCAAWDEWNISFLYYTNQFWNPNWGGKLRFYNNHVAGGILEYMDEYEIGSVDFKPNRLLMFDGRIPHGADAPNERARYADRKSIVLRGDEVELVNKEDFYNANDRFYNI